jgi:iron-sulfur cluster assembly protein
MIIEKNTRNKFAINTRLRERLRTEMAITMTESAATRVKTFLANRGKGVGMRVGVKTNGCSGMSYVLEFVDEINPNEDEVFEIHGVKVVVDKKSLVYVNGTEVDFTKEGLNEGFKFNNPNEKGQCGCGESFTV